MEKLDTVLECSDRRERSLYAWFSKVTGVTACWIEGVNDLLKPVWGIVKQIGQGMFFIKSKKFLKAGTVLGMFLSIPLVSQAQTSLNLVDLSGSEHGFALTGIDQLDDSGSKVASGDINGDGLDDIIIAARFAEPAGGTSSDNFGQVYIVFGSHAAFPASTSLSTLNGTNGFSITGESLADGLGSALSTDDINGDGVDDLIVGSLGAGSSGKVYVIFGSTSSFGSTFDLTNLNGSNGFIVNGTNSYENTGAALTSGDINGDSRTDIIIGAPFADPGGQTNSGSTYVVFNSSTGFESLIELSDISGSNGFVINGISGGGLGDRSGSDVSSGDINGDGIDDVLIGAPRRISSRGDAFVVFGKSTAFASSMNLSTLNGSNGFALTGLNSYDQSGNSVEVMDINGDGIGDAIVSSPFFDNGSVQDVGRVYVVFGKTTAFSSSFSLEINDTSSGFRILGANAGDSPGEDLAVGDINNDGIQDLVMGAQRSDFGSSNRGRTFVVYGKTTGFTTLLGLNTLDGSTGFALNGVNTNDESGEAVAIGDINNDGLDDVIIGAPSSDPVTNGEGTTYVFTNTATQSQTVTGDEGFRMLSAPTSGTVYKDMLAPFFTQGFTGSDVPSANDNVWTWNATTQAFESLSNQNTDTRSAGEGFLFYIFSDDDNDGTPEGFPKTLTQIVPGSFVSVTGGSISSTSGTVSPSLSITPGQFFLSGNPFNHLLDWDSFTRRGLSGTVYIWSDAASAYQTWNGSVGNVTDGLIAPFQGFFIEGFDDGSGVVVISMGDSTPSGSASLLKGKQPEVRALKIHAQAGDIETDAWISFQEGAEETRDTYDALALQPLASQYLQIGTLINDQLLQINAQPNNPGKSMVFPLVIQGRGTADKGTLSFEGLDGLKGWTFSIQDKQTGEVYIIEEGVQIELDITAINTKEVPQLVVPTPTPVKAKASSTRYELIVVQGGSDNTEDPTIGVPTEMTLDQNFPNPFNPTTNISFGLSQVGNVRLQVFDLLGREVATLVNGQQAAGRYTVTFDASSLSSGIYVYRLQAGGDVLTRKLTLIK